LLAILSMFATYALVQKQTLDAATAFVAFAV
jgi:hypothetical protein